MSENRLSYAEIKVGKSGHVERPGNAGILGWNIGINRGQLFQSRLNERRRNINAVVVAAIEIRGDFHSSAHRATTNVEKSMLWLEPFCAKEIELKPADFVPHAADDFAMKASCHFLAH